MKINITVDPAWILSGDVQHAGFITAFVREANLKWESSIGGVRSSLLDCAFEYSGSAGPEPFARELKALIESVSGAPFDASVFLEIGFIRFTSILKRMFSYIFSQSS